MIFYGLIMSTSLLRKLPDDFTCFDNLNMQGLIFWSLFTFTVLVSDQIEYACQLFHSSLPKSLSEEIERIQKIAMQIIFPGISYSPALAESGLLSLYERREFLSNKLFNDIVISSKHKLKSLPPLKSSCYTEHLRTRRTFKLPEIHTNRFRNSFIMHYYYYYY